MKQILQYVWKHKLFQKDLTTVEGHPIEVLEVGLHNTSQGPHFYNAKIKVCDKIWVGSVEILRTSEDWYSRRLEFDNAYNSVILYIVESPNRRIVNEQQQNIFQCEIKYSYLLKQNIDFLLSQAVDLPCQNYIKEIPKLLHRNWLNVLLLERLERKSNDITLLLERYNNSWTDVFYVLLSRSMGFGSNSELFHQLALSLPLSYVLKQGDNQLQIEALLFGQAGLLNDIEVMDGYSLKLRNEYDFLKNKYSLEPLDERMSQRLRFRPAKSTYIRIAQLASLLGSIQGLYSRVISSKDVGQVRLLFHHDTSSYWHTHNSFGVVTGSKRKYIEDSALDIMIINTVVPLLFAYGRKTDNEQLVEKAIRYLEDINPESNTIVKQFLSCGMSIESAFQSQAIIQLKREYCEKRKCLYCRIGYGLLTAKQDKN